MTFVYFYRLWSFVQTPRPSLWASGSALNPSLSLFCEGLGKNECLLKFESWFACPVFFYGAAYWPNPFYGNYLKISNTQVLLSLLIGWAKSHPLSVLVIRWLEVIVWLSRISTVCNLSPKHRDPRFERVARHSTRAFRFFGEGLGKNECLLKFEYWFACPVFFYGVAYFPNPFYGKYLKINNA